MEFERRKAGGRKCQFGRNLMKARAKRFRAIGRKIVAKYCR